MRPTDRDAGGGRSRFGCGGHRLCARPRRYRFRYGVGRGRPPTPRCSNLAPWCRWGAQRANDFLLWDVSDHSARRHLPRRGGGESGARGGDLQRAAVHERCVRRHGRDAIAVTTGTMTSNINFTLASCSAMTLSPPLLASGVVGRGYRQVFSTSGGSGPYVLSRDRGATCRSARRSQASTGVLEGTPRCRGVMCSPSAWSTRRLRDRARVHARRAGCAFALSPASATVPAAGGAVTITIAARAGRRRLRARRSCDRAVEHAWPGRAGCRRQPGGGATNQRIYDRAARVHRAAGGRGIAAAVRRRSMRRRMARR